MARYDSADLLARCKRYARRPTNDAEMQDSDWYALMDEAQEFWYTQIAAVAPQFLAIGPKRLTGPQTYSEGGQDYTAYLFTGLGDSAPAWMMVTHGINGRVLTPGPLWSPSADYAFQGTRIVIPQGRESRFTEDLFVEVVPSYDYYQPISASQDPILQPLEARSLIAWRALIYWSTRGGHRDPRPFQAREAEVWGGGPMNSQGLLARLKKSVWNQGGMIPRGRSHAHGAAWWRSGDLG